MSEVDWSQFDDWLEYDGTGGVWPSIFESKELTEEQKQVVERNATLLLDYEAWHERVDALEVALQTIEDEKKRKIKREEFCIRFNQYHFDRVEYPELTFFDYFFPCSVSFKSVNFGNGGVSFNHTHFGDGEVVFTKTHFGKGDVSFLFCDFGNGHLSFIDTQFGDGEVNFTFTKIGYGFIQFKDLKLSKNTTFVAHEMTIKGMLNVATQFTNIALFCGTKTYNTAVFSHSIFLKCPDFRYAEFERPPEVSGMEVPPPEMGGEKLYKIFKTCSDEDDVARYRKLKAMALAASDHEKDGEFFAYEMMAKRGHEITGFGELLANSFYYHVSNYGQSWIRPLIGMAISCFTFFWIYFIYAMGSLKCLENVWFSIRYSMLNTLPFVSALYRSSIQPKDYESGLMLDLDKMATVNDEMVNGSLGGLMFFSFIQQIIGIVLLFFLLLGLRNRFRLK